MTMNVNDILEYFQIDSQSRFTIIGSAGILMAKMTGPGDSLIIKRANMIKGKLAQFDPKCLSVGDRRSLIRQMCDAELTNSEIAGLLNCSQSLVSTDIRIMRGYKS